VGGEGGGGGFEDVGGGCAEGVGDGDGAGVDGEGEGLGGSFEGGGSEGGVGVAMMLGGLVSLGGGGWETEAMCYMTLVWSVVAR
jgi:hypothetical protein